MDENNNALPKNERQIRINSGDLGGQELSSPQSFFKHENKGLFLSHIQGACSSSTTMKISGI